MIEHSNPTIGKKEKDAVIKVIQSGYLAEGEVVHKFEEELSDYIGSKGGIATSTGTLALHLALLSLNIAKDDQVIIPNYVCRSVLNSVLYCGTKPILCDVNKEDYNISIKETKKKINRRTKAIIAPHMFGYPADIDELKNLGVYIIEDCAHSIGAEYKGKKVGSWGDLSIFSFEGTKYIVTGEGGMVLANSNSLVDRLRKLKDPNSLDYKTKYTYRMTNLQAAIGRVQLAQLNNFVKKRREIAKAYDNVFCNFNIGLPKRAPDKLHVFHRYMITINKDINKFMLRCYQKGIKVKRPIKPFLLNKYLGLPNKDFPNSAYIMKYAVSIPIYPTLSQKEKSSIIEIICQELKKLGLCK